MIFMDVSSIPLGSQVAALSDGLVPDLIPRVFEQDAGRAEVRRLQLLNDCWMAVRSPATGAALHDSVVQGVVAGRTEIRVD